MDLGKLMKQAQQMQKDLKKVEDELASTLYDGQAQSGAVKCSVNGKNTVVSLIIDEELFDKDNKGFVEDLIVLAINEANSKASQDRENKMGGIAGGMNIPGLG